jgi:hypothetical protein
MLRLEDEIEALDIAVPGAVVLPIQLGQLLVVLELADDPVTMKRVLSSGSCWIPGSWICRWRITDFCHALLLEALIFSIALKMSCASRTTREHKTPESNKSVL